MVVELVAGTNVRSDGIAGRRPTYGNHRRSLSVFSLAYVYAMAQRRNPRFSWNRQVNALGGFTRSTTASCLCTLYGSGSVADYLIRLKLF